MNTQLKSTSTPAQMKSPAGQVFKRFLVKNLSDNCGLVTARPEPTKVDLNSPASTLMVDFTKVHAINVSEAVSVDDALEVMRSNGIRSLMVLDKNGEFVGVVTAMDIMGRKPMVYANESGTSRVDVLVQNIMLAKNKLKAISRNDVEQASLADLMRVFNTLNEQHVLVVDDSDNPMQISGMFSASDFKRALGIDPVDNVMAKSFSDLERVIYENKELI